MIKIIREVPWKEIETRVRRVALLERRNGRKLYPYAEAQVKLKDLDLREFYPTTYYLIEKNLRVQENLMKTLHSQNHGLFHMTGGLEITDGNTVWTLTPPVVEASVENVRPEAGNRSQKTSRVQLNLLIDGAHRIFLARRLGITTITAIHISNIPEDCPFYAYPNSWEEVGVHPAAPALKKHYRDVSGYALYRDLATINGSAPR